MGRSCMELWMDVHYVLKMISLSLLLGVHFFVLDSYSRYYRFYAYGNGYFFAALINHVILLYGYTWFAVTIIWECCLITFTILMLVLTTSAFTYDYYYDDYYVIHSYIDRYYRYNARSFATSIGLTTISTIILVIDLLLLLLKASGRGGGSGRGGRQRQQNASYVQS